MRSVRSGSSINNRRVSPVAWKSLMGVLLPSLCIGVGSVAWATETDLHATAHNQPAWAEQLKGQTIVEDAQEGHVERTGMMERQHQRIMEKINDQLTHDSSNQHTGGMYNNVNMLHQYGAGARQVALCSPPTASTTSAPVTRAPT